MAKVCKRRCVDRSAEFTVNWKGCGTSSERGNDQTSALAVLEHLGEQA